MKHKNYIFESHFYINNITTIQYVLFDIILVSMIHLAIRHFTMQKFGSDYYFGYIIHISLFIT